MPLFYTTKLSLTYVKQITRYTNITLHIMDFHISVMSKYLLTIKMPESEDFHRSLCVTSNMTAISFSPHIRTESWRKSHSHPHTSTGNPALEKEVFPLSLYLTFLTDFSVSIAPFLHQLQWQVNHGMVHMGKKVSWVCVHKTAIIEAVVYLQKTWIFE